MSTSARSNFAQAFSQWLLALVRLMISAGSPRSLSNRANASNGDEVSTPPKSQMTASIINTSTFADGDSTCLSGAKRRAYWLNSPGDSRAGLAGDAGR